MVSPIKRLDHGIGVEQSIEPPTSNSFPLTLWEYGSSFFLLYSVFQVKDYSRSDHTYIFWPPVVSRISSPWVCTSSFLLFIPVGAAAMRRVTSLILLLIHPFLSLSTAIEDLSFSDSFHPINNPRIASVCERIQRRVSSATQVFYPGEPGRFSIVSPHSLNNE